MPTASSWRRLAPEPSPGGASAVDAQPPGAGEAPAPDRRQGSRPTPPRGRSRRKERRPRPSSWPCPTPAWPGTFVGARPTDTGMPVQRPTSARTARAQASCVRPAVVRKDSSMEYSWTCSGRGARSTAGAHAPRQVDIELVVGGDDRDPALGDEGAHSKNGAPIGTPSAFASRSGRSRSRRCWTGRSPGGPPGPAERPARRRRRSCCSRRARSPTSGRARATATTPHTSRPASSRHSRRGRRTTRSSPATTATTTRPAAAGSPRSTISRSPSWTPARGRCLGGVQEEGGGGPADRPRRGLSPDVGVVLGGDEHAPSIIELLFDCKALPLTLSTG